MEKKYHGPNAIGIDFGTYKTTLSVWNNGHAEVIPNTDGERFTRSCVCYTEDEERLVGQAADQRMGKFPQNFVSGLKRLIGRQFSDPVVAKMVATSPFKIAAGPDSRPVVTVNYGGQERQFSPEEIASVLFYRLKRRAEDFLGTEVKYAVLSVPPTFHRPQIEALKDAATIAGLYVLSTVSEASLAATDYTAKTMHDTEGKLVLLFNLGAGYLHLALCTVQAGSCLILAVGGNDQVGGEDVDNALVEYCAQEFQKRTGISVKGNSRALRKLKSHCEKAKKILSSLSEATIDISSLAEGEDFTQVLKRDKFDEINKDIFESCLASVQNFLASSNMEKEDIADVVLVGGTTRIPRVKQLLKFFFGKEPLCNINADEAVADGAAIHAAILSNEPTYASSSISKCKFSCDILAHALLVRVGTGPLLPVLAKNSPIPAKGTVHVRLDPAAKPRAEKIEVLEEGGVFLDSIALPNYEAVTEMDVTMEIDEMSIMTLSFTCIEATKKPITSGFVVGCASKFKYEELEKMMVAERGFRREDEMLMQAKESRNELEKLYYSKIKARTKDPIASWSKTMLEIVANYGIGWLEKNPSLSAEDCKAMKRWTEDVLAMILSKQYKRLGELPNLPELLKEKLAAAVIAENGASI